MNETDYNLLGARPKTGKYLIKNGSKTTKTVLPKVQEVAKVDHDDNVEEKPKQREKKFENIIDCFELKSSTELGLIQGKNGPKCVNNIGQNVGKITTSSGINERGQNIIGNNQKTTENSSINDKVPHSIAAIKPVETYINSPSRKLIRKGTVAAMKGVFGHEVETEVGANDSLKRLQRSCLKQIKPSPGKKKSAGSRRPRKRVSLSSNQSSILDCYHGESSET